MAFLPLYVTFFTAAREDGSVLSCIRVEISYHFLCDIIKFQVSQYLRVWISWGWSHFLLLFMCSPWRSIENSHHTMVIYLTTYPRQSKTTYRCEHLQDQGEIWTQVLSMLLYCFCVVLVERGDNTGGFSEKLTVSNRANASWAQNGPTSGQGWAHQRR